MSLFDIKNRQKVSLEACLKHRSQVHGLACVPASPATLRAAQQVWNGVFLLKENRKIPWIKWGMQNSLQGSQSLYGEKQGLLKEGIVKEEH